MSAPDRIETEESRQPDGAYVFLVRRYDPTGALVRIDNIVIKDRQVIRHDTLRA